MTCKVETTAPTLHRRLLQRLTRATRPVGLMRGGLMAGALALPLVFGVAPAAAQSNPGFFIPPSGPSAPSGGASRPAAPPRPVARPTAPPANIQVPPPPAPTGGQDDAGEPPPRIDLPPVPDLPPLPRASPPPASVIGIISVPDVMRVSTAAQGIDKVLSERRDKLNADVQKEQLAWREAGQLLQSQRGSLNAEQVRTRERELQDRITNSTKGFRDRNRWLQEAAQLSYAQIENELIAVIRQVSDSRGMNIVLHRQQVALNANEFDITVQVADQLNKLLPSVQVPADGSSPIAALAAQQKAAAQATPSAPAAATPTAGQPAPAAPNAPRR